MAVIGFANTVRILITMKKKLARMFELTCIFRGITCIIGRKFAF